MADVHSQTLAADAPVPLSSRDASHNYESVATTLIRAQDLLAACAYERKPSFWARFRKKPKTETIAMATPARVAEAVAKAALALGAPLSMKSIFRVLQDLPGFKKNGPDAYFGFGSLNRLARDIAHRRPDLKVWRGARGLVIQAKAKPA